MLLGGILRGGDGSRYAEVRSVFGSYIVIELLTLEVCNSSTLRESPMDNIFRGAFFTVMDKNS